MQTHEAVKRYPTVVCEVTCDLGENDEGRLVPCTWVTCGKCEHRVMSYGDSEASALRSLRLLRHECPRGESNFYLGSYGDLTA